MRRFSLLLLLATAAAPAVAQDHEGGGGRHRGSDSSEQSESRPQRGAEHRNFESRAADAPRADRSGGPQSGGFERGRDHQAQVVESTSAQPLQPSGDDHVRLRRGTAGTAGTGQSTTSWRERERHVRTIPDTQPVATQPPVVQRDGLNTHHRRDYRDGHYTRWSHDWRHDRRYDWDHYRRHHRSIFRLGFYYDPFGWGYRSWSIGSYLYPSYYGSRFWLNDPWQYRLPPAYGPYRWVRYWNDALLVNIYTGEVVDVMHGFFW
jgi:hypothetical protein